MVFRNLLAFAVLIGMYACFVPNARADEPVAKAKPSAKLHFPTNWDKLDLTEDQKDKLAKIQAEYRDKLAPLDADLKKFGRQFQKYDRDAQRGYRLDLAALGDLWAAYKDKVDERKQVAKERDDAMENVLTAEQDTKMKRLFGLQHVPDFWRKLEITDAQFATIYPIAMDYQSQIEDTVSDIREMKGVWNILHSFGYTSLKGAIIIAETEGDKKELKKKMLTEMESVLTAEQEAKLERIREANGR